MSEPLSTSSFAPGSVRITRPSATLSEDSVESVWPKPASASVFWASASGCPVTLGTETGPSGAATIRLISEPIVAEVSPWGDCSSTVPAAFSPSGRSVTSTVKPMSSRISVALSMSVLRTSGTRKLPVASQIWTVSPRCAAVPAAGCVRVTIPRSTLCLSSLSTYSGTNPASSSWATASSRGMSVTSGTSAASGPPETVTSTVEPTGISSPPRARRR